MKRERGKAARTTLIHIEKELRKTMSARYVWMCTVKILLRCPCIYAADTYRRESQTGEKEDFI
ncbi:MAG: hypothetical protein MR308_05610 [Lachnospiraceae bacterium]|nr:hypothetical protein [Lachnospiraceae bacterium]